MVNGLLPASTSRPSSSSTVGSLSSTLCGWPAKAARMAVMRSVRRLPTPWLPAVSAARTVTTAETRMPLLSLPRLTVSRKELSAVRWASLYCVKPSAVSTSRSCVTTVLPSCCSTLLPNTLTLRLPSADSEMVLSFCQVCRRTLPPSTMP